MFSLFKPRPPLTTGQRVNLDLLMRRTIETIEPKLPKSCSIVHNLAELQIDDDSTPQRLELIKKAIVDRFPKVESEFKLDVSNDLSNDLLEDPLRMVVECANQYSNHFWQASGLIDRDEIHPNLTHLLPVCCGLGVLVSDAAFYDSQSSVVGWHRWSISRSGFYNATEIGYASALLARYRGERNPDWIRLMRLDSRDTAKQAFRYFDDCDHHGRPILFDAMRIPSSKCDPTVLTEWLNGNDPTFAIAAGCALIKQGDASPLVTNAALDAVRGSNRELIPIAIRLLGRSRGPTEAVRAVIEKAIANRNQVISIAAIESADELGFPSSMYRKRIKSHLDAFSEGSGSLVNIVANAGAEFKSFEGIVCQHLGEAMLYSNEPAIASLVNCLHQISNDPKSLVEREIDDPELKDRMLNLVDTL